MFVFSLPSNNSFLIPCCADLIKKAILLILVISTVFLIIIEVTWSLRVLWEKNSWSFRPALMRVSYRQLSSKLFHRKLPSFPFQIGHPVARQTRLSGFHPASCHNIRYPMFPMTECWKTTHFTYVTNFLVVIGNTAWFVFFLFNKVTDTKQILLLVLIT